MNGKNITALTLAVMLALFVGGVSASAAALGDTGKMYQIAAGPTGGNFYPMAVGIEKVLKDKMNSPYRSTVVATGGSLDNANLIAGREVDMGIITQVDALALYEGKGPWADEAFTDLRIITPLIPGHVRIVVQASANINTLEDLKGKRFSPGQMGGGESTFRDIWTACGFSYGDLRIEYLDMNGMVDAMKDGKIDGCFFAGSEPYAALMDLKTSMGSSVKIYSFTDDEVQKILTAVPRYAPWVSKAGTYPNQNYDATIIAYHYYLGTTDELPADLAYDACKGLNEQQKWLSSIHAGYVNLDIEKAPGIMGMTNIPIHEGALKYWKEVGAIK